MPTVECKETSPSKCVSAWCWADRAAAAAAAIPSAEEGDVNVLFHHSFGKRQCRQALWLKGLGLPFPSPPGALSRPPCSLTLPNSQPGCGVAFVWPGRRTGARREQVKCRVI